MKLIRRFVWALAGIVWFLWLGYEDKNLTSIMVVAVLLTLALGIEGLSRWTEGRPTVGTIWLIRSIIIGAFTGAAVGPIAVLLALIKISLHHHAIPDFSFDDVRVLVRQSLNWIAAGSFFGAAVGFVRLSQKRQSDR